MELKDLLKISPLTGIGPQAVTDQYQLLLNINITKGGPFKTAAQPFDLGSLVAAIGSAANEAGANLGGGHSIAAACHGYLYQDDDAHDTCTLTACLNPLHPGPCKGWKHTLHSVAPKAWEALEAARVEKANKTRLAKIADLKAQGKPIPKKLLTPILPKPHPNAGKTAQGATGEAHAAGKAVSDAAGVHVNEPGKVTLGQAVKAVDATSEKGPKGKKPTVASKGIAFVIAQEKVTPQYKLDKAAGITPEQWDALSADDKATIRGELAKIQKDGFGPQQKKATELLDKLAPSKPKTAEPEAPKAPTTGSQAAAIKSITEAILGPQSMTHEKLSAQVEAMKTGGPIEEHPGFPKLVNTLASTAQKKAYAEKMPNVPGIDVFHKQISEHIAQGKPGIPESVAKVAAHHESIGTANVKTTIEDAAKPAAPAPKLGDLKPGTPNTVTTPSGKTYQKVEVKPPAAPETGKPKTLPKHVEHAIAMAKGQAVGASWSKNHLAAYQPLSADDFKTLPPDVQAKVVAELEKAQTKFLDPKKVQAAKDLLEKFGHGDGKKPAAKITGDVSFAKHLHSHDVTEAQAKNTVEGSPWMANKVAKESAGITPEQDPDVMLHAKKAADDAIHLVDLQTRHHPPQDLTSPDVQDAVKTMKAAAQNLKVAQLTKAAADKASAAVTLKLANDTGDLSPLQKASLQHYKAYLDNHPVNGADIPKLQGIAVDHVNAFHDAVAAAKKKANAPKAADMTSAQLNDHTADLLGPDALDPKVNLTLDELKAAKSAGAVAAEQEVASKYPPGVITDPNVAAKMSTFAENAGQYMATLKNKEKLQQHIAAHHIAALDKGVDVHGKPLTVEDKKVIGQHGIQLKEQTFKYLNDVLETQKVKLNASKADLHATALKVEKDLTPKAPAVELSDYDKATVEEAYAKAWKNQAVKAVTYGLAAAYGPKAAEMKAHDEYAPLTQDLGNLRTLAGKVALAHAEENAAQLSVPTDPDTGEMEDGPEHKAFLAAHAKRAELESEFSKLHKVAQARLDKIRTDVGLKKRTLPKFDAPAVKTAAAEEGYYKTTGYSGPNYGKPHAGKHFMVAKVGPKLAVVHKTASEKKLEKLSAPPAASPGKIENVAEPVKLGDGSSIAHIPDATKKQITADFKAMPNGKYLADPAEDIFDNLVVLAAAHGKTTPGGLSVDQILKTIDETHSKNLGVANSGMLEKKITDWLGTATGKMYAETHNVPDAKKVKQLSGEPDLPAGVTLAPGEKVQKLAGPGPHDPSIPASAFKGHTAAEAQAVQDAYMKANGIKWSPAVKKSLTSYTGSAYQTYNAYLRGSGLASPSVKQDIINIQSAMMPLPEHTLLKRGTGWPPDLAKFQGNPEELLGKTFEDKGFVSTAVAGSGGHFSSQPLQLVIEAPKGTPAAFINGISHYKGQENEMLLAAGTRFKVLSVDKTTGGNTVIRVRVVGDM